MITKRIIPCLDVRDGRVVKGVNFLGLRDVDSPVKLARYYSECGADELVFYDITASAEGRKIFTDILREAAATIFIPLTVGGGISSVEDFDRVLKCGADKVSVNSGAIRRPELIGEAAKKYGDQCVVLSADIKRVDGAFHIFAKGGREDTGLEAIQWIKDGVARGAGEIVANSMDTDGVKGGFDLELLERICDAVRVPVIASGGAGSMEDFTTLFKTVPEISAGLAASVFHFGEIPIPELKKKLRADGIEMRMEA
ncbi:MAG: imidazole glycerol phosphate synthase subunit HisF [Oscillospiraceae bacterium]|jgi:cyclase|nr:imidazole glycerol phosphate synthase subunit HisF [Oscillospiraceae bacterium]